MLGGIERSTAIVVIVYFLLQLTKNLLLYAILTKKTQHTNSLVLSFTELTQHIDATQKESPIDNVPEAVKFQQVFQTVITAN